MSVGAIVQARMSSRRFPGKVLAEAGGKPLLLYLLERLARCRRLDGVVVATSADRSDDVVQEFCGRTGFPCVRGPLEDVAGRFLLALDRFPWGGFVRANGDSPLLDPELVDRGVGIFREGEYDLVTNVQPRTFPKGQSVEVVRSESFRAACRDMTEPEDREHVTRFFYRNSSDWRIRNFEAGGRWGDVQLSVDTPEDMERFARIVAAMERPHWEYGHEELARMAGGEPRGGER